MPPGNLSLDPAANLWSSGSPNANAFSNGSSPEANSNAFNMNANMYPTQSIDGLMGQQQQPTLSPSAPPNSDNSNNNAGQVFMGVSSPQPWRFTVMNEEKR
jgi:hypothetical protein